MEISEKALQRGRILYIIEAALEHLASILVAGSFLATITKELGVSDSLTGILSSIVSLGCLFQLISLSIQRKRMKRLIVVMSVANQLLFMLLYVIPLTGLGKQVKIAAFVVMIILAYLIKNIAHPKKMNWLMSLVKDGQRGVFTANKEIVSLVVGMAFTFGMGAVVDAFSANGNIRMAFIISALVMFALMVFHTLSLVFTVEKERENEPERNILKTTKNILKNKNVMQVAFVSVLYYVAKDVTLPFMGTYSIGELGLSLKMVSAISMLGSISRILVSRLWGKYADRNSFAAMIEKCFVFFILSLLSVVFSSRETGIITMILYTIFHGIALGGINSAITNMVFDYVELDQRADSLAICQAASGLIGFITTLLVSPLVTLVQKNENQLFGIPMYVQQLLAVISILLLIVGIVYVRFVFIKRKTKKTEQV